MATTSKARRRPRKGPARTGKPATRKIAKKRAKSGRSTSPRRGRSARRPAKPARRRKHMRAQQRRVSGPSTRETKAFKRGKETP